jgi:hypothetical protein
MRTGFLRCFSAMAAMRLGSVAEKSAVCRSAGSTERIASRSSLKPMSSISSASSSTTAVTLSSTSVRRPMWSMARPGVATTASTPLCRLRNCWVIDWPP